jgi:hypothetical protein
VPLSIIECVKPITLEDIGEHVRLKLKNDQHLMVTVAKAFPFDKSVGFEIVPTSASSRLLRQLRRHTEQYSLVPAHLEAIDLMAKDIIEDKRWSLLGYDSREEFTLRLESHKQQVQSSDWAPLFLTGQFGSRIICIDDEVQAEISRPAGIPALKLGAVRSLDTSPLD